MKRTHCAICGWELKKGQRKYCDICLVRRMQRDYGRTHGGGSVVKRIESIDPRDEAEA